MTDEARKKLKTYAPTITFAVVLFALLTNLDMTAAVYDKVCQVLNPLVIGLSIALVLNVPLRGIEKLLRRLDRKHRLGEKVEQAIAFCLVLLLTPLAVGGIIAFFVPQFVDAVNNFINIVRDNSHEIIAFASRFGISEEFVNQKLQEILAWITDNVTNIAGITFSTIISLVNSLTSGMMSLMLALYILVSKKRLARQCTSLVTALLPARFSAFLRRVLKMFVDAFSRFLSCQLLGALILGLILFSCMTVLDIPLAMSVCSLTMVLALIPYIGATLALVLAALMIVLVNSSKALIFVIVFLIVQQVDNNLVRPRIVGESLGLPSYITLLAVAVGGEIMGIVGMLVFVPITFVIYTLLGELVHKRLAAKK